MGQRYWVIGGQYSDCRFSELEPGTEVIHGPYQRRAEGADGMAAADLPRPLRGHRTLLDLRGAGATVSDVLDRRRTIIAEPSPRPRRRRGPDPMRARIPRRAARAVRRPPPRAARPASRAAGAVRRRRAARFPRRHARDPRGRLDGRRRSRATCIDRRVEITGPTNAKMVINALNSGAQGVHGRLRGRDLADLGRAGPGAGQPARLLARPPRLHRSGQRQALCGRRQSRGADGPPARLASAGGPCDGQRRGRRRRAVRFRALPLAQRARRRWRRAPAPISICPSSRARHEAALWSDVFAFAESKLRLERGTIKATVLIETLPAAFEMDEILYALQREYRRPQLRPLGLYLLVHQAPRPLARPADARPRADDHG